MEFALRSRCISRNVHSEVRNAGVVATYPHGHRLALFRFIKERRLYLDTVTQLNLHSHWHHDSEIDDSCTIPFMKLEGTCYLKYMYSDAFHT
jgi:hypothetical protein